MSEATLSENTETAISEIVLLAGQIGEIIGVSYDAEFPAASDHLNDDGAWEYHFETDEKWGFVAASPDAEAPVETTYPGWRTLTVESGHWAIFYEGTFAGVVSAHGGRIGGCALLDWNDHVTDLETAMLDAFRAERDALTDHDRQRGNHE